MHKAIASSGTHAWLGYRMLATVRHTADAIAPLQSGGGDRAER